MKRRYQVAQAKDRRVIGAFLKREGQFLLPMVELVERADLAIDEVIEVVGRAEAPRARPVAGARVPLGRGQLERRLVGAVHDQPAWSAATPEEVPGHDEPDRQHPLGGEAEDPQGDELEKRSDGAEVGSDGVRRDREELPQNHRLRPALDAQGPPR